MPNTAKISTVVFDCFGVLYTGSLVELANNCRTEADVKDFYDITRAADHGFVSREDYIARVTELTGLSVQEVIALMDGAQVRSGGVFGYARELKERGYKVAVLSNIGRDTIQKLFNDADYELFDDIIASGDIGVTKPYLTAYDRALDRLRVLPQEAIMIDDSYANVSGAVDAGMYGVVFTSLVTMKKDVEALLNA